MPNIDLTILTTRSLPTKVWINALEKALGQAWFNGMQSIVDSCYENSQLPPYALSYWKEISVVLEKGAAWKKAEEWLTR